ncbi:MAG: hypothetical protein FWG65_11590 [Turicibacter sp.]|nr:hypothetical protein [Turicibacter sp.]
MPLKMIKSILGKEVAVCDCGANNPKDYKFCNQCGIPAKVDEEQEASKSECLITKAQQERGESYSVKCNCGAILKDCRNFCTQCGSQLKYE